jgi:hypothetical protein
MDFVSSVFYFSQESVEAAKRSAGAESFGTITPESSADTEEPSTTEPPIEDYDSLNVNQVSQRLGELSVEEFERLREYEAQTRTVDPSYNASTPGSSSSFFLDALPNKTGACRRAWRP